MTGFMKTVSLICAKSPIFHFDVMFHVPCKKEKIGKEQKEKGDLRVMGKMTDFPFNFFIVTFGLKKRLVRSQIL